MGAFLDAEKHRLAAFKATAPYFSDEARADGIYKRRLRPFCLPRECAEENLFLGIRQSVIAYFAAQEIKWHDAQDRRPSNHLCDSQVCCVNFLFPFANQPRALAELLRPLFPTIQEMIPLEAPGQFVSCEWIGQENYLEETISRNRKRTRGANFTSADAAVMFAHADGRRQIVLIEWKYTEAYSSRSVRRAKSGTDRTTIYARLFERGDCPIRKDLLSGFEDLFFDPFDQLMRQQFLAHEMERAHELGGDVVSLLHIAPTHNRDFRRVTSPALVHLGDSVTEVWKRLISAPDRFCSVNTEDLFGRFPIERFPEMASWWEYTRARYVWLEA